MEIRLQKVRDRKRLKMGLPIVENESISKGDEEEQKMDEIHEKSMEDSVMEGLRKLREKQEVKKSQYSQGNASIREWDVGKEGVDDIPNKYKLSNNFGKIVPFGQGPIEKPLLSQKEWEDSKRCQRNTDFAPPTSYDKTEKLAADQHRSHTKGPTHSSNTQPDRNANINKTVESTYPKAGNVKDIDNGLPQWNPDDHYKSFKTMKTNKNINSSRLPPTPSSLPQFLDVSEGCFKRSTTNVHGANAFPHNVKENSRVVSQSRTTSISPNKHKELQGVPGLHSSNSNDTLPLDDNDKLSKLSTEGRLKLHHEMVRDSGEPHLSHNRNVPCNSLNANQGTSSSIKFDYKDAELEGSDDEETRNKGVEIAPPCSMEYYHSSSNKPETFQGFNLTKRNALNEMEESFKIGMSQGSKITKHSESRLIKGASSDSDTD